MKLYYHKTDGGAEYLTDTYIECENGHKEGHITDDTKYMVRIDGDITKDAEIEIREDEDLNLKNYYKIKDVYRINDVELDVRIFDEEMVNYDIQERSSLIDYLIEWISETNSDGDKYLMKEDLETLISWDCDYVLSSINDNEYFQPDTPAGQDILKEILRVNSKLLEEEK